MKSWSRRSSQTSESSKDTSQGSEVLDGGELNIVEAWPAKTKEWIERYDRRSNLPYKDTRDS